jgi:hypothetical protein
VSSLYADRGQPIALTSSVVVPFGQQTTLSPFALQPTMLRQPIEATGLRFFVSWNVPPLKTLLIPPTPAAYLRVSARVGRHAMTNGFVPIACLNPRVNDAVEFTLASGSAAHYTPYSYCTWKFDKPLIMPLGVGIEINLQAKLPTDLQPRAGGGGAALDVNSALTVTAVLVGRTIKKVPAQISVPYVSKYIVNPAVQLSQENDFRNLNGVPLRLRRMIMRMYQINSQALAGSAQKTWAEFTRLNPFAVPGTSTPDVTQQDYTKQVSFRLLDENGKAFLSEYTPLSSAFPEDTLSLPIERDLPPGRGLTMTLSATPNSFGVGTGADAPWIAMFGLHGYRMEAP